MPYTHHSHSGSFCKHAHDTLDSVIATAIGKQFKIFSLTEHVPRLEQYLVYPEENELGMTPSSLKVQFDDYVKAARIQQSKINSDLSSNMKILVGFESEGGIDDAHLNMCLNIREKIDADIIVGSVHHIHGIDIDFDKPTWEKALQAHGGLHGLYREYFTLVQKMIETLKPEVVAHFDLIRLFSYAEVDQEIVVNGETQLTKTKIPLEETEKISLKNDWPDVWRIIENCVTIIVENNLTVELNSAAIRKGWNTPYPQDDIMKFMISKGVKFVLSDDSHGDDQVGLNYQYVLEYIKRMKIKEIYYYDLKSFGNKSIRNGLGNVVLSSVSVDELCQDPYWKHNYS